MLSLSSRTKAAFCHLAALSGVATLVLPLVISRLDDENKDFVESHALGAMAYQAAGLVTLVTPAVLAYIFADPAGSLEQSALLGFASIVWFSLLAIYLLGAVYLTMQAWSGSDFDMPPFNQFVHDEP